MGSVSRVILHKLAGWNVLRASASKKLKAWVASRVAETLGEGDSGRSEGLLVTWDALLAEWRVFSGRSCCRPAYRAHVSGLTPVQERLAGVCR